MANDDEYDDEEEEEDEEYEDGERSWLRRFTYGFLWALGFYIITNNLISFLVGFIIAFRTGSIESAEIAVYDFFDEWYSILFAVQVSIFMVFCYYGLLPGVSKYDRRNDTLVTHPPPPEAYGFTPEPTRSGDDTTED